MILDFNTVLEGPGIDELLTELDTAKGVLSMARLSCRGCHRLVVIIGINGAGKVGLRWLLVR